MGSSRNLENSENHFKKVYIQEFRLFLIFLAKFKEIKGYSRNLHSSVKKKKVFLMPSQHAKANTRLNFSSLGGGERQLDLPKLVVTALIQRHMGLEMKMPELYL